MGSDINDFFHTAQTEPSYRIFYPMSKVFLKKIHHDRLPGVPPELRLDPETKNSR
jgi:hypothetical protein